jgi:small GTP-binding protein
MKALGLSDSKVILVGDPAVGKTSIIQQYNVQKFEDDAEATIGASFVTKVITTPLGSVQIHIWDTAGQERYRSLIPMYSRNAVAALLVIDVANRSSYDHMEMWLSVIQTNCPPSCRVYCVANKMDLQCAIPLAEFEKWCQEKSFPLFKTSAKQFDTVAPLFQTVAEDILRSGKPMVITALPEAANKKGNGCC